MKETGMRILHVVGTLDPATGGPAHVVARLAAAQAALGHDVSIASYTSPDRAAAITEALHAVPGVDLCRRVTLGTSHSLEKLLGRQARGVLRKFLVNGCDYLHLHGVWEGCLLAMAAESRAHGIPYAVVPHGMLDPWSLRQSAWKKKLALALGYRKMLAEASFLHALNRDEATLMKQLDLGCPMEIIPNGVFLEEIEPLPAPDLFRAEHPSLGERPFILFLGRLHRKKGLDILADAFRIVAASCPEWMLVVAGPDMGEGAAFTARIADLGLTDRVILPGPLYGRRKLAALAAADLFCLPSHQEGFSVAVIEALTCGIPVVVSKGCHFPEVAEAGAGEIVPLDAGNVGRALARLATSPELRRAIGRAGRALVRDRYTWSAIAIATIEAYGAGILRAGDRNASQRRFRNAGSGLSGYYPGGLMSRLGGRKGEPT